MQLRKTNLLARELSELADVAALSLEFSGQRIGARALGLVALDLEGHFLVRKIVVKIFTLRATLQHPWPRLSAEAHLLVVARFFASGNASAEETLLQDLVAGNPADAVLEFAGWGFQVLATGVDAFAHTFNEGSSYISPTSGGNFRVRRGRIG